MDFIVPGLVMMSVIQNSYGNISSSFFGAKFGRHVEELLVSPMPNWVILGGYVAGAVLRGLLVGIIVLCIAMFFTKVRLPHPFVTLTTVLLGATIFSLAGFVNAVYAKKFDDVAIVPTFILTPLTYLGGVFYSVKLLPGWAEALTHANPIFYMVNAFRYGLLGVSDVPVWIAYALMLGFVVGAGRAGAVAAQARCRPAQLMRILVLGAGGTGGYFGGRLAQSGADVDVVAQRIGLRDQRTGWCSPRPCLRGPSPARRPPPRDPGKSALRSPDPFPATAKAGFGRPPARSSRRLARWRAYMAGPAGAIPAATGLRRCGGTSSASSSRPVAISSLAYWK